MKKILVLTVLFAAGAALLAETRSVVHDGYRYTFNLDPDGSDCWDNPITAVSLDSILPADPRCAPSNSFKESTVIDLCAVEKIIEASIDYKSEGIPPVRLVEFADGLIERVWNPTLITEVNLPGALGDINQFLNDYCSPGDYAYEAFFPKLCSVNILGDGEFASSDGAVYTSDLKELWFCPHAKTSLNIPSACTTIGADALIGYCHGLETITGGEGLLYVSADAFGPTSDEACESEPSPVDYDEENAIPFVRKFKPGQFMMVGKMVFGYRGPVGRELDLPYGVRAIAAGAFTDPKFSDTFFYLDDREYNEKTDVWEASLRWVGADAFSGTAFERHGSLHTVIFGSMWEGRSVITNPVDVSSTHLLALADRAFANNPGVVDVTIPASVEEIGESCFAGCPNLERVTFLGTPKILGPYLFENCPKLKTVRFEKATLPPAETAGGLYSCTPEDLVTYVPGAAVNWPVVTVDGQDMWKNRALSRSIRVIAQEGVYGKWTLAELGITVPKAGTVFTPKAYGLPGGLVLKSNAAVKRNGKVTVKAKTSWWIEGAPLESLDYTTSPAYVVVTLNGEAVWQPLQLEVRPIEPTPVTPDLVVNKLVVDFALPGVGKGWSVSGLPPGLKFTSAAIKAKTVKTKVGKFTRTTRVPGHSAYRVYGTPTAAGLFTVRAKKKNAKGYYELKKFTIGVEDAEGSVPAEGPEADFVTEEAPGAQMRSLTAGLGGQMNEITVAEGTELTASGLPKGVMLVKLNATTWGFAGAAAASGTYYVTVTATKNGRSLRQRVLVKAIPMPSWVIGSYNGYSGTWSQNPNEAFDLPSFQGKAPLHGLSSLTVSSSGKVSGKFDYLGRSWSFAVVGLKDVDDDFCIADFTATYTAVDSKGKAVPGGKVLLPHGEMRFARTACGANATILFKDHELAVYAAKNLWATDYKSIGAYVFNKDGLGAQSITFGSTTEDSPQWGLATDQRVTLRTTTAGAVNAAMTVYTGIKDKGVKQYYTATCSTTVIPATPASDGIAPFRGYVCVSFKKGVKKYGKKTFSFPGYNYIYEVPCTPLTTSWCFGEFRSALGVFDNQENLKSYGILTVRTFKKPSDQTVYYVGTYKAANRKPDEFSGRLKRQVLRPDEDDPDYMLNTVYATTSIDFGLGSVIPVRLRIIWGGDIGVPELGLMDVTLLTTDYRLGFLKAMSPLQNVWFRKGLEPILGSEFSPLGLVVDQTKRIRVSVGNLLNVPQSIDFNTDEVYLRILDNGRVVVEIEQNGQLTLINSSISGCQYRVDDDDGHNDYVYCPAGYVYFEFKNEIYAIEVTCFRNFRESGANRVDLTLHWGPDCL